MVVTGAGPGIMAAGMEGAGRDMSFGVTIRLPFENEPNPVIAGDPKLVSMKYFFTRKLMLIKESQAFLCLPGGFGTLDEAFELLTLVQTGKSTPAPIVMLDIPNGTYWTHWKRVRRRRARGARPDRRERLSTSSSSPTTSTRRATRSSASTRTTTRSATSATSSSMRLKRAPVARTISRGSTCSSPTCAGRVASRSSSRSRWSARTTTSSTTPASRSGSTRHHVHRLRDLIDALEPAA